LLLIVRPGSHNVTKKLKNYVTSVFNAEVLAENYPRSALVSSIKKPKSISSLPSCPRCPENQTV
jgi:hypothetical protein